MHSYEPVPVLTQIFYLLLTLNLRGYCSQAQFHDECCLQNQDDVVYIVKIFCVFISIRQFWELKLNFNLASMYAFALFLYLYACSSIPVEFSSTMTVVCQTKMNWVASWRFSLISSATLLDQCYSCIALPTCFFILWRTPVRASTFPILPSRHFFGNSSIE